MDEKVASKYNRDQVLKSLREFVADVAFTKVDGSNRVLRCTLRSDMIPRPKETEEHVEKKYHRENPDVLAVWDVVDGKWKSFRIETIQYVQIVDAYN